MTVDVTLDVAAKPVGRKAGELEPPARGVSAWGGGQLSQRDRVLQARAPRAGQCLPLQPGAGRPGRLHSLLPALRVLGGDAVPLLCSPAGGSLPRPFHLRHDQTRG